MKLNDPRVTERETMQYDDTPKTIDSSNICGLDVKTRLAEYRGDR